MPQKGSKLESASPWLLGLLFTSKLDFGGAAPWASLSSASIRLAALHGSAVRGRCFGTSKVPPQGASGPAGGTGVLYPFLLIPRQPVSPHSHPSRFAGRCTGFRRDLGVHPECTVLAKPSQGGREVAVGAGPHWSKVPKKPPARAQCLGGSHCRRHPLGCAASGLAHCWVALGGRGALAPRQALPPGCLPPGQLLPAPACPVPVPRSCSGRPGASAPGRPLSPRGSAWREAETGEAKCEKTEALFRTTKAPRRAEPAPARRGRALGRAGRLVRV